jgi:hypothetical protein
MEMSMSARQHACGEGSDERERMWWRLEGDENPRKKWRDKTKFKRKMKEKRKKKKRMILWTFNLLQQLDEVILPIFL